MLKNVQYYSHAFLLSALCLLGTLLVPAFSVKTLFLKDALPVEKPFTFPFDEDNQNSPYFLIQHNASLSEDGKKIYLDAGNDGFFYLRCPPPHNKWTTLHVDCYTTNNAGQELVLIDPLSQKRRILSRLKSLRHHRFDLTGRVDQDSDFIIGIIPASPHGKTIIEKIHLRQADIRSSPPRADTLVIFYIFTFILFVSIAKVYKTVRPAWIGGAVSFLILLAGSVFNIAILQNAYYWLFLLIMLVAFRHINKDLKDGPVIRHEWLLIAVSVGLVLRWNAFMDSFGQALHGDAPGYFSMAHLLRWNALFDTGIREPLYIWIQSVFGFITGPNMFQFRALTLLLSLGIVAATYFLALRFSGKRPVAFLASFFMAVNNYAVYSSTLGERTELFVLFVLLFCICLISFKNIGWISEACTGICAGAVCLTWQFGGIGVVLLYGIRWFYYRIRLKHALLGIFCAGAILAPHLIYEYNRYGDMFHPLNKSVNYFRNTELYGASSPVGGRRSWMEYLIKELGVFHLAKRTARNYMSLFFNPFNPFNKIFLGFHYTLIYSYFLYPFYLLGFVLELKRKRIWFFLMLGSFINFSLYSMNDFYDPRLLFFINPFFSYLLAVGMLSAFTFIRNTAYAQTLMQRLPNVLHYHKD